MQASWLSFFFFRVIFLNAIFDNLNVKVLEQGRFIKPLLGVFAFSSIFDKCMQYFCSLAN